MGFDLSNNVLGGEGFGYDENEDVSEVVRIMWWGEEGAMIIMKMITWREHCCGGEGRGEETTISQIVTMVMMIHPPLMRIIQMGKWRI